MMYPEQLVVDTNVGFVRSCLHECTRYGQAGRADPWGWPAGRQRVRAGDSNSETWAQQPFEPKVGQAGKDVVWVPTPQALVEKMLDMAKVTPQDFVMDLGSGDGRTVITAAKRGATAMGIEYNPDMVELSKKNAAKEGVTGPRRRS